MAPSIQAFQTWATWVDEADARKGRVEESKKAAPRARQVGNG
jgi:hypothetical protein